MGMILGTAAYMARSRRAGKPSTGAADIWAFGCVLFEMLTGTGVQGEDVSEALASVLSASPTGRVLPGRHTRGDPTASCYGGVSRRTRKSGCTDAKQRRAN